MLTWQWWPFGTIQPEAASISLGQRIMFALSPQLCFIFSFIMGGVATFAYYMYRHDLTCSSGFNISFPWGVCSGKALSPARAEAAKNAMALTDALPFTRLRPSRFRLSVEDYWRADRVAKRRALHRESLSRRSIPSGFDGSANDTHKSSKTKNNLNSSDGP